MPVLVGDALAARDTARPSSATSSAETRRPAAGPQSGARASTETPTGAPGSTAGASGSTWSGVSPGSRTSQRSAEFQKRRYARLPCPPSAATKPQRHAPSVVTASVRPAPTSRTATSGAGAPWTSTPGTSRSTDAPAPGRQRRG